VGASAGTGLLFGNGDGTFQPVVFPANLNNLFVILTADFNHDGKADLLSQGGQVALGNGDGTFTVLPSFLPPSNPNELFAAGPPVADFNGDGNLDVSGADYVGSSVTYGLFLGNGDGTFGSFLPLDIGGNHYSFSRTSIAGAADMNGDGRPDLLLSEWSEFPAIVVLLNTTAPNFEMSASALSPATVVAGNSATSTMKVTPTFGFKGTVTLSCSGLPSGATCGFNPASIPNSSGTSKMTITTSATTPAGSCPVKVSGTSGSLVQSTTVTLVVQAAPNFAIAPVSGTSTSQTISPGQSAKFGLEVTPAGGFAGTVDLSCGITPVVTPAATCALSSSSVQISGSGSQPVTVTVGTTGPVTTGTVTHVDFPPGWMPLAWTGMLLGSGWLLLRNRRWLPIVAAPLIVLALALWAGCGGGSSSSQTPGTPLGTYTVTVAATSGSLHHNMTLTVIVQ